MFWKKASEWAEIAPNSPSAIRFGIAATKGFEKLVIVPNDPDSLAFLTKVDELAHGACLPDLVPTQIDDLADQLDTTVKKFAKDQRRGIEDSIGQVYADLREILGSLEGAIASSDKLGAQTEGSSARLLDLQSAKNYDEVVVGLKNEIASLNSAVSQYRADAKLIRKIASKHVEDLRTKLKVAEKAVKTDPLTKLGNRNAFDLQLSFAISKVAQGDTFCLAIVDVDNFKSINDAFGHLCGDDALIEIAKQLSETFAQNGSSVVRFGGDEFAVLYKGSQLQLEAKLERVNSILAKSSFSYNGSKLSLRTSFGSVLLTQLHTQESAFADADKAMYFVKRQKRAA
jgi:diguanylate cyclase (GGDEF)-like protein